MNTTLIIVAITVIISLAALRNAELMQKLILYPAIMHRPEEYYRLLTSGFIHADMQHLFFNMFSLWFFGDAVTYMGFDGAMWPLYLTGIIVASLPSFLRNRSNSHYLSLGASGGVAAVMFFCIYYSPWSKISFMFIPVGIPSILFAIAYVGYSMYMDKQGGSRINHNAHLWGAVYGMFFAFMIDPTHGLSFLNEIMHPVF